MLGSEVQGPSSELALPLPCRAMPTVLACLVGHPAAD